MFTCSSDGFVKLFSITDNFAEIKTKKCDGVKIKTYIQL